MKNRYHVLLQLKKVYIIKPTTCAPDVKTKKYLFEKKAIGENMIKMYLINAESRMDSKR